MVLASERPELEVAEETDQWKVSESLSDIGRVDAGNPVREVLKKGGCVKRPAGRAGPNKPQPGT